MYNQNRGDWNKGKKSNARLGGKNKKTSRQSISEKEKKLVGYI